jgi:hypothetical protein
MPDGGKWQVAYLLFNEGSFCLLSRPARLLAGWAQDTTAAVHGEVWPWVAEVTFQSKGHGMSRAP